MSLSAVREEGGGGVRREVNKENSFLGLEADELNLKADLAADAVEVGWGTCQSGGEGTESV